MILAFYYSFFKKAALGEDITRDDRAQHRERINPLKEYTILPERLLAWIYRSTGVQARSMVLWYLGQVSLFQGLLSVALGILILKLTNVKNALLAQLLFIVMGLESSRTALAFCLRESFGIPLFIIKTYFVVRATMSENSGQCSRLMQTTVGVLMLLTWQFSQFLLLAELLAAAALLALNLVLVELNYFESFRFENTALFNSVKASESQLLDLGLVNLISLLQEWLDKVAQLHVYALSIYNSISISKIACYCRRCCKRNA